MPKSVFINEIDVTMNEILADIDALGLSPVDANRAKNLMAALSDLKPHALNMWWVLTGGNDKAKALCKKWGDLFGMTSEQKATAVQTAVPDPAPTPTSEPPAVQPAVEVESVMGTVDQIKKFLKGDVLANLDKFEIDGRRVRTLKRLLDDFMSDTSTWDTVKRNILDILKDGNADSKAKAKALKLASVA
jgi:hypothetical protein